MICQSTSKSMLGGQVQCELPEAHEGQHQHRDAHATLRWDTSPDFAPAQGATLELKAHHLATVNRALQHYAASSESARDEVYSMLPHHEALDLGEGS